MRRDQLEHAIRTACQIIGQSSVLVVGSQSILGTFSEDELPADATMSIEVDILPIADDNDETARLADLIEGVAGEFSPFEELHGFSIDGVDLETSVLPAGWRERLVKVQNANRWWREIPTVTPATAIAQCLAYGTHPPAPTGNRTRARAGLSQDLRARRTRARVGGTQ
ncbi:MAG: hypothetical protein ACT4PP_00685 [Sporichthyaceae bacterium]